MKKAAELQQLITAPRLTPVSQTATGEYPAVIPWIGPLAIGRAIHQPTKQRKHVSLRMLWSHRIFS